MWLLGPSSATEAGQDRRGFGAQSAHVQLCRPPTRAFDRDFEQPQWPGCAVTMSRPQCLGLSWLAHWPGETVVPQDASLLFHELLIDEKEMPGCQERSVVILAGESGAV